MSENIKAFIISIFLLLIVCASSYGQNDAEAIRILDKFSSAATSAPSVSMKFKLITTNEPENTTDTLNGSIILSKDKYKLELPDNIVWFNGQTSSSYLLAEKEVTITKPDKKDNSFQNRPSAIFSMYKKGYKCRLIEEKQTYDIIDLYPEDLNTDLMRVRLTISKSPIELKRLEYKKKDGVIVTLLVNDYSLKEKPDADTFNFNPAKYKGVEVIDMR